MRYDDPRLLSLLAGEYVLGTLTGTARRRFDRLLAARPRTRTFVAEWEDRFVTLSLGLAPVAPPARVWSRISEQLGLVGTPERTGIWQTLGLWRALAAALAVIAVALGVERVTQITQMRELEQQAANARQLEQALATATHDVTELRESLNAAQAVIKAPIYVSVMADPTGKPLWLLKLAERELRVTVVGAAAPQAGKSYELWMLPDGGAPVSLGILPDTGEQTVALSDAAFAALTRSSALAVSLEPAGGSPTGAPTGPVLFSAPLVRG